MMFNDYEVEEVEGDLFFEIYAETEGELMLQFEDYSVAELRVLARCASRHLNNKLHGSPLIGKNFGKKKAKAEGKREGSEYSSNWSAEQTVTIDEFIYPGEEDYMNKSKTNSLDCCAAAPANKAVAPIQTFAFSQIVDWSVPHNSMESDMNYNTPTTNDYGFAETRKYLLNRLNTLGSDKYNEAEAKFLPVTEQPKTGKALKDALANGWLKVNIKDDEKLGPCENWLNYVELQDPSKPRDLDAYAKATALIIKGKTEAKDAIMVLPQADGLAALKAFESTTFH